MIGRFLELPAREGVQFRPEPWAGALQGLSIPAESSMSLAFSWGTCGLPL